MSAKEVVHALVKESKRNPKLEGQVYVQISLKESPAEQRPTHPILIPLPHKFRKAKDCTTCLIVKDPASNMEPQLTTEKGPIFDEVIGVGKLRRRLAGGRKNRTTKLTEEFAKSFTFIFVHERVAEPLVECMGPKFYKYAKSLPVKLTINSPITDKQKKELDILKKRILRCSQLILKPDGKTVSLLVGHTLMDESKLTDNIQRAMDECKRRIKKCKFFIKTPESLALPVETE